MFNHPIWWKRISSKYKTVASLKFPFFLAIEPFINTFIFCESHSATLLQFTILHFAPKGIVTVKYNVKIKIYPIYNIS